MLNSEFLTFAPEGLYCQAGGFYVDPSQAVQHAVISHAHGDHACPHNVNIYCTAPTQAFMQIRQKKNAGKYFHTISYGESFELNGVKITFYPAGHILGSAQILMEYEGVRYLYTGDIKLQDDLTCEPVQFVKADVLITETTFANPEVIHPPAEQEILKLNDTSANILLGAYSLGKTQRLINLIDRFCPGRQTLLHHSMMSLTQVYDKFGYSPGKYAPYDRKLMKNQQSGLIYIVPPLTFECYFRARGVLRAFASGWKRLQRQNDIELFISDHIDWNELLTLIKEVSPSEIWTLHGNGEFLKSYLSSSLPVKILH